MQVIEYRPPNIDPLVDLARLFEQKRQNAHDRALGKIQAGLDTGDAALYSEGYRDLYGRPPQLESGPNPEDFQLRDTSPASIATRILGQPDVQKEAFHRALSSPAPTTSPEAWDKWVREGAGILGNDLLSKAKDATSPVLSQVNNPLLKLLGTGTNPMLKKTMPDLGPIENTGTKSLAARTNLLRDLINREAAPINAQVKREQLEGDTANSNAINDYLTNAPQEIVGDLRKTHVLPQDRYADRERRLMAWRERALAMGMDPKKVNDTFERYSGKHGLAPAPFGKLYRETGDEYKRFDFNYNHNGNRGNGSGGGSGSKDGLLTIIRPTQEKIIQGENEFTKTYYLTMPESEYRRRIDEFNKIGALPIRISTGNPAALQSKLDELGFYGSILVPWGDTQVKTNTPANTPAPKPAAKKRPWE